MQQQIGAVEEQISILKYVPEEIISYQNYHIERCCNGKNREMGMESEMKGPKYIISKPPKGENGGKTMI